jgi:hypothetical protein
LTALRLDNLLSEYLMLTQAINELVWLEATSFFVEED